LASKTIPRRAIDAARTPNQGSCAAVANRTAHGAKLSPARFLYKRQAFAISTYRDVHVTTNRVKGPSVGAARVGMDTALSLAMYAQLWFWGGEENRARDGRGADRPSRQGPTQAVGGFLDRERVGRREVFPQPVAKTSQIWLV
jgi:hypothetical protein